MEPIKLQFDSVKNANQNKVININIIKSINPQLKLKDLRLFFCAS